MFWMPNRMQEGLQVCVGPRAEPGSKPVLLANGRLRLSALNPLTPLAEGLGNVANPMSEGCKTVSRAHLRSPLLGLVRLCSPFCGGARINMGQTVMFGLWQMRRTGKKCKDMPEGL
jgi:hypothetical protein